MKQSEHAIGPTGAELVSAIQATYHRDVLPAAKLWQAAVAQTQGEHAADVVDIALDGCEPDDMAFVFTMRSGERRRFPLDLSARLVLQ